MEKLQLQEITQFRAKNTKLEKEITDLKYKIKDLNYQISIK